MTLYLGENLISGVATPIEGARNIGQIIQSTIPLSDAGLHLLDGSLIQGNGIYADFVNYIAELFRIDPYAAIFAQPTEGRTAEQNWQASVSYYGVCGKFVYDSVNNTVRLPKITGFIEGTVDSTVLGDLIQAGLPNITGQFYGESAILNSSGAFSIGNNPYKGSTSGSSNNQITFDASLSSSIYGKSSTVQPQSIKTLYYIVIATSTKTDIEVDIDEIATDLNGKADTDLSNINTAGKSFASGLAMPSSRYIDLTLGASGATYTAPANGYFCLDKAGTQNEYIDIRNNTTGLLRSKTTISAPGTESIAVYMPCKKGDEIAVVYTATGTTNRFRFIYAEGENV